jgi:UDP-3-O-[3-hydroxymyristoyl] glucosamine N-acyltransferase
MPLTLEEIAHAVGGRCAGDGKTQIAGVASVASAAATDIVFAEDDHSLEAALGSAAGAVISAEPPPPRDVKKPLLISHHPRLIFARVAQLLHEPRRQSPGVHSTAVVHRSAKIGKHVSVGPNVILGEDCVLGENTRIGPGSCISNGVVIGSDCFIDTNVTIYSGTRLGNRVAVHAGAVLGSAGFGYVRDEQTGRYEPFPQFGRLEIGDDVEIGANATIDRGALDATIIGRGVKIDNLVHIAHNVIIGDNVVIAALTGISGSSVIEKDVVCGGQVGIADHVRIEEGAILGAQSGVPSKKVIRGKGVVFWGTPARPISEYLKELAVLARMAKKE